jgi:F-type H+-transporting ATPase subunit b
MKLIFLSLALATGLAFGQHEGSATSTEHKTEGKPAETHETSGEGHKEEPSIWWKWANFAILAGGLGYLIGKNAPAFFNSRTAEIQKGIADATEMRKDADIRAAEMDKRMANLEAEIAALRASAKSEITAEAERINVETAQLLGKIQTRAEQEIASAAKSASLELKSYSAKLALELAEAKLRGQMNATTERELLGDFLKGLNN